MHSAVHISTGFVVGLLAGYFIGYRLGAKTDEYINLHSIEEIIESADVKNVADS